MEPFTVQKQSQMQWVIKYIHRKNDVHELDERRFFKSDINAMFPYHDRHRGDAVL